MLDEKLRSDALGQICCMCAPEKTLFLFFRRLLKGCSFGKNCLFQSQQNSAKMT
jgi:hypothetical protein